MHPPEVIGYFRCNQNYIPVKIFITILKNHTLVDTNINTWAKFKASHCATAQEKIKQQSCSKMLQLQPVWEQAAEPRHTNQKRTDFQ